MTPTLDRINALANEQGYIYRQLGNRWRLTLTDEVRLLARLKEIQGNLLGLWDDRRREIVSSNDGYITKSDLAKIADGTEARGARHYWGRRL